MTLDLAELKRWYDLHREQIYRDFFTFLKFPSISTDMQYKSEVRQTALWVKQYLEQIGLQGELWETSYHPVVFASHTGNPSKPTLLIYHHYDVQPIDPLEKWKSPPFEPVLRDENIYARGASDNKGQCFYTLTALKALFDLCKKIDLNIKLFIEGEEECGSRGSTEILQKKREALKADYLLIIDAGLPSIDIPAITLGLRGLAACQVTCRNATIDLHSGIQGGVVLNPNRALVQLLAKLWDQDGKVAIPGFYDDVVSPKKEELEPIEKNLDESYLRRQFGVKVFQREKGSSLWEASAIRPTLEINGISGGYTGTGFKTVIPSEAFAKISCRLVPNQDPEKILSLLTNYFQKEAIAGLEIETIADHGGKPVRSLSTTQIARICGAAFEEVFKTPCRNIFCGASVPIVADLVAVSGGDVAILGVGLDSDDIHAPNEHFSVRQFELGYLTMGRILGLLRETLNKCFSED